MRRVVPLLMSTGWLMYGLSFLLTVITTMQVNLLGWQAVWGVDLVGWQAGLMSLGALDNVSHEPSRSVLTFLAGTTNLAMLLSPLRLLKPQSRVAAWLPFAMLVATVVNVFVFHAWSRVARLGAGYYAWCGAFGLITVALYLGRHADAGGRRYGAQTPAATACR
jgi:hypothetical protein